MDCLLKKKRCNRNIFSNFQPDAYMHFTFIYPNVYLLTKFTFGAVSSSH